ncbi:MAG TPA: hypothetical protein VEL31_04525, partial [Ktedonobacteraceae bacterium]|nr:hypothetical protein [Ktedonobacteraceae bacterium]
SGIRPLILLRFSQVSICHFFLQRTQVAVLLAQACQVARPRVMLAELLVQDTHLCQECAGLLVVLATSLGDQSFRPLPIQLYGLARARLFGGPGDLKGDVAESVVPIAHGLRNEIIASKRCYVNRPRKQFQLYRLLADGFVEILPHRRKSTFNKAWSQAISFDIYISLRNPWA